MFFHHHRHNCCETLGSPLLKFLTVGAMVYVGAKALHHWHHYHKED